MTIMHNNHVWSTDITFIPLPFGFMYLVAVIDWHSRFILGWQLSNTLETHFCLAALFGRPAIFNTDQGSQFTSHDFTQRLLARDLRISMDGRGRALDNIFYRKGRAATSNASGIRSSTRTFTSTIISRFPNSRLA